MINIWGILLRICEVPITFGRIVVNPLFNLLSKLSLQLKYHYFNFLALIEKKYVVYKIEHEVKGEINLRYASISDIEEELFRRGARELLFRSSDISNGIGWSECFLEYKGKRIALSYEVVTAEIIHEHVSWQPLIE